MQIFTRRAAGLRYWNKVLNLWLAILALGAMTYNTATSATIPTGTVLAPGDIGVIRINEDGTDGFSLVTLVPLNSGTHFYITENGWGGATLKWVTNESTAQFITNTAYPAGTVFHFDEEAASQLSVRLNGDASPSYLLTATNFNLSTGDQIIIYQGTNENPVFITGLHHGDSGELNQYGFGNDDMTRWSEESSAVDAYLSGVALSRLPTGLTNGMNCVSLFYDVFEDPEKDNSRYNGITEGTRAELMAAINNKANWIHDDGTPYPRQNATYTVQPDIASVSLNTNPTLNFANDIGLSDNVASDGDGGSVSITDLDLDIVPIDDSGAKLTAYPVEYHDGSDWPGYPAILTYGNVETHFGWAVKSRNGDNFSLKGLDFHEWGDWGGYEFIIEAFDNGISKAQVQFTGNIDGSYIELRNPGNLSAAFNNIDEVWIYKADNANSFGTLNNIQVGLPATGNTPPTASSVAFAGILQAGEALTGTYTFADADNDAESGTTYKWYRSDDEAGTNKVAIVDATATAYTLQADDAGKYISFEIIPHDGTDAGAPVESGRQGPVTIPLPYNTLSLDGDGQYALVSHNSVFDFEQGTIEMWIKPDWEPVGIYNPCLISLRSNVGQTRFSIHMERAMDGIGIYNGGPYNVLPYSFTRGQWYHVAFVMDAVSTEIYVNGVYIGDTGNGINTPVTGLPLKIGASETAASSVYSAEFFEGEIDEVRIWNTQRTSGQIQESMGAPVVASSAGLAAYYPIDAGVTDESNKVDRLLQDYGLNTLNGTLFNYWTPLVTTAEVTDIGLNAASLGGEVMSDEAPAVEGGVVYNTTGTPTTADTKQQMGSGTGAFSQLVTGLSPGTTYYVRAYAINAKGTAYGEEKHFTTTADVESLNLVFPAMYDQTNNFQGIYGYNASKGEVSVAADFNPFGSDGIVGASHFFDDKLFGFFLEKNGGASFFGYYDGTDVVPVEGLDDGLSTAVITAFAEYEGDLYFILNEGNASNHHLWRYSPLGQTLTKISASLQRTGALALTAYNGKLYFGGTAGSGTRMDLYSWDGSTVQLVPNFANVASQPIRFAVYNGYLYMVAAPSGMETNLELYRYSDTGGGNTELVADLNTTGNNLGSSNVYHFTQYADKLFFVASYNFTDGRLYSVNTANHVTEEYNPPLTNVNTPGNLIVVDNTLYFTSPVDNLGGRELMRYNGTGDVTKLSSFSTQNTSISSLVAYDGDIYFVRDNGDGKGTELQRYSINSQTFTALSDINASGSSFENGSSLTALPLHVAPVVYRAAAGQTYFTGDPSLPVASDLMVSDIEKTTLIGATVSITSGFAAGDELHFTDQSGISGSYSGSGGVLTLSGTATVAEYQAALRSVTFGSSSTEGGDRVILFRVDNGERQSSALSKSAQATVRVSSGTKGAVDFETKPEGLEAQSSAAGSLAGAFTITADGLGQLNFISTTSALTTAFDDLEPTAGDNGMIWNDSQSGGINSLLLVSTDYVAPKYLAFRSASGNAFDLDGFTYWDDGALNGAIYYGNIAVYGYRDDVQVASEIHPVQMEFPAPILLSNDFNEVDEVRLQVYDPQDPTAEYTVTTGLFDTFLFDLGDGPAPVVISPTDGILYVNRHVTGGTGSGDSWENAIPELADALKWAREQWGENGSEATWNENSPLQVWVAEGTYKPLYDAADGEYTADGGRDNAFVLVPFVQLYGGFAGNETVLADRNWKNNETILSGDLDNSNSLSNGDAYHVVVGVNYDGKTINEHAVLDGFTVTGGNANENIEPQTVNGVSITQQGGGGLSLTLGNPTVANVIFTGNNAFNGGAVYNSNSSNPSFTEVSIVNNTASGTGAGMFNGPAASPLLVNVEISKNTAAAQGGGMGNVSNSNPKLINVVISENVGGNYGGAMYNYSSSPVLTNVTISGNSATVNGGGLYNDGTGTAVLANTLIWGNAVNGEPTGASASIHHTGPGAQPSISYSLIANSGGSGSAWNPAMGVDGGHNLDADPLFDVEPADKFALTALSPALNVGDNNVYTAAGGDLDNDRDLVGAERLKWATIDIGAYEYQLPPAPILEVPEPGTYKIGDELVFVMDFHAPVTVNGEPRLLLTVGETQESVVFVGLSEDKQFATFKYTVKEDDLDNDGLDLFGTVDLEGSSITFDDTELGSVSLAYTLASALTDVQVDGVRPVLTEVSIASDNETATAAKIGDKVTVTIEASEAIEAPEIEIAGNNATVSAVGEEGLTWIAEYVLTDADESGIVVFTISGLLDATGNTAPDVTTVTDESTVTFYKTAPVVEGVVPGEYYNEDVTATFEGTATLNGEPYVSGTPVTEEGGYKLTVTDAAGNSTTVSFTVDKTAPVVSGVEDGGYYNGDVTATFNEGTATLNGEPFTSGTAITEEGGYKLTVTDAAGNSTTVAFTVDKTAPVVTGTEDGGYYNEDVTATFNEGTATLNGEPFTSGTAITEEGGYKLTVTDAAGNSTTVAFTVDKTAPVVTGTEDGGYYNEDVTVSFDEGTATLNGEPYVAGTPITEEGKYTLVVTDASGNETTVSFTVDKTVPEVTGVEDGGYYNEDVTVTFNEGTATLNGNLYVAGTPITEEGGYKLTVTDASGNMTVVAFTLDKTAPVVTDVVDGGYYSEEVIPAFNEGTAMLNGQPYVAGTPITEEGGYKLTVTDAAGNITVVAFTIDKTAPLVSGVEDGGYYNEDVMVTFDEGTATLNGEPYVAGTPITDEGGYKLTVTDAAGNMTVVAFTVDKTVPVVSGVEDGGYYNEDVTVTFDEGTATLNGQPYVAGTPITEEGEYELVVTDASGNETTVSFTVDKTTPEVTGVEDGGYYNEDVTVTFDEGTAMLNGQPYVAGTPITEEGEYELVVTDASGNETTVSFTVDKTVPVVTGLEDGGYYNEDVTVTFDEGTATLNGQPYVAGTPITEEGEYELVVTDASGNETTVSFTVDRTAPQVSGVANGSNYESTATPIFDEGSALLNGKPYHSGTPIKEEGTYELIVTDKAGNTTTTHFAVADLPGVPTDLQATPGNKQATLSWQAPAGELLPVTDYVIQYSGDGGQTWITAEHPLLTGTRVVVIGLDNNRAYQFRIAAVNEFGAGAFSKPLGGIIPTEPVPDGEGNLPEPAPGETVVITDGKVEAITLEVVDEEYLRLRGDGYAMMLASLGVDGERIPISAIDAVIRLVRGVGAGVYVSGDGFEPGTVVTVYLFSVPELVGHIPVKADGTFAGTLAVPVHLEAGRHTLQANGIVAGGGERSVSVGLLLVDNKPQEIDFGALAEKTYGDGPVKLSASATSGLPVSYTVTDAEGNATDIVTVLEGNELHIHGAGDVVVTASQTGDLEYAPADPVVQTLHIGKAPLTVTVSDAQRAYGEANPVFELSYSGFVNGEDTSSLDKVPAAATDASETSAPGSYAVTIAYGESANYTFTYGGATLTVVKAQQAITFNAPAEVTRDAGSIQLDVSASSGLPVSLTIDDQQVATLDGTTLNIHRLGTINITATQEGDGNHEAAAPVTVTVRVVDPSAGFAVRIHPAVSPNGDGINEFLMIEGIRDYPENRVTVITKNGTVVYEAEGYDNNNVVFRGRGTGGINLAAGTYFYIVEVKVDGRWSHKKGYFVVRY